MALYLKFLDEGRVAPMGKGTWDLLKNPRDGEPVGKWMPKRKPALCRSGWHACRLQDVSRHVRHGELWLVELRGEVVAGADKVAAESARLVRQLPWDRQMVVSLAADWAEMVLHISEGSRPTDDRPRRAIEVARSGGDCADAAIAAAKAAYAAAKAANAANAAYAANAANAAYAANAANAANAAAYAADDAADEMRLRQGQRLCEVVGVDPGEIAR